jgi:uncharacterized membrane protein
MSDLIAVAYPDRATAEQVRGTLARLMTEHVIELADAVVVERTGEGKVKLHQAVRPGASGAAGGAMWGGLIGLLFLAPLVGMAIGAAAGGAAGAMSDYGIDDDFMRRLGHELRPGGAALIVLVTKSTPDKVLPRIREFGGTVLQTSLDEESEARLREALDGSATAGAAA